MYCLLILSSSNPRINFLLFLSSSFDTYASIVAGQYLKYNMLLPVPRHVAKRSKGSRRLQIRCNKKTVRRFLGVILLQCKSICIPCLTEDKMKSQVAKNMSKGKMEDLLQWFSVYEKAIGLGLTLWLVASAATACCRVDSAMLVLPYLSERWRREVRGE